MHETSFTIFDQTCTEVFNCAATQPHENFAGVEVWPCLGEQPFDRPCFGERISSAFSSSRPATLDSFPPAGRCNQDTHNFSSHRRGISWRPAEIDSSASLRATRRVHNFSDIAASACRASCQRTFSGNLRWSVRLAEIEYTPEDLDGSALDRRPLIVARTCEGSFGRIGNLNAAPHASKRRHFHRSSHRRDLFERA